MTLSVVLTSFVLVAPVELPDKTMFATLVLASRFRPLPVLAGVGTAFAMQSAIAVVAGTLLSLLPRQFVMVAVTLLFAVGAVLLWRSADDASEQGKYLDTATHRDWPAWRIALASFGITFLAEWGDLSQLATAGLAARYDAPLSVFIGAFAALLLIASLAVFVGAKLVARLPVRMVGRTAALLFAAFAVLAGYEAITAFAG